MDQLLDYYTPEHVNHEFSEFLKARFIPVEYNYLVTFKHITKMSDFEHYRYTDLRLRWTARDVPNGERLIQTFNLKLKRLSDAGIIILWDNTPRGIAEKIRKDKAAATRAKNKPAREVAKLERALARKAIQRAEKVKRIMAKLKAPELVQALLF